MLPHHFAFCVHNGNQNLILCNNIDTGLRVMRGQLCYLSVLKMLYIKMVWKCIGNGTSCDTDTMDPGKAPKVSLVLEKSWNSPELQKVG